MKTRQQALDEAGEVFADVLAIVSSITPRKQRNAPGTPAGPRPAHQARAIRP